MSRPCKCRWVDEVPAVRRYTPAGASACDIDTVVLGLDELESLRLADLEGLYHSDAAERMNVSRPTFGRILQRARSKLADAILNGKNVALEGGPICSFSPAGVLDGRGHTCRSGRRSCRRFQAAKHKPSSKTENTGKEHEL